MVEAKRVKSDNGMIPFEIMHFILNILQTVRDSVVINVAP
jgi:hypothetical protein